MSSTCVCVNRPSWLFGACVHHPSVRTLALYVTFVASFKRVRTPLARACMHVCRPPAAPACTNHHCLYESVADARACIVRARMCALTSAVVASQCLRTPSERVYARASTVRARVCACVHRPSARALGVRISCRHRHARAHRARGTRPSHCSSPCQTLSPRSALAKRRVCYNTRAASGAPFGDAGCRPSIPTLFLVFRRLEKRQCITELHHIAVPV